MSVRRSSRQPNPPLDNLAPEAPTPARKTPAKRTPRQTLSVSSEAKIDTPPSKRRKTGRSKKGEQDNNGGDGNEDEAVDNDDPFAFMADTAKLKQGSIRRPKVAATRGRTPAAAATSTAAAQASEDSEGSEGSAIRVRTSLSPSLVVTKAKKTPKSAAKGRPAAKQAVKSEEVVEPEGETEETPRARGGRGRPKSKAVKANEEQTSPVKKKGGRPRKKTIPEITIEGDGETIVASAGAMNRSPQKKNVPANGEASQEDSDLWDMELEEDGDLDTDVFSSKPIRATKLNAELRKAATPKKPSLGSKLGLGTGEDQSGETAEIAVLQPEYQYTTKVSQAAVKAVQKHAMAKFTGRNYPLILAGLDEEYKTVYRLMEQTITQGEGNTMLLIGPRGSGKTATVERSILELRKEYSKDFLVVRLNGLIQNDEKTAVKEIWRQLGAEMEVEEHKAINFADTLTSLLAVLSHPSEHIAEDAGASIAESATSISVVFLLSEFESFALHARQTLLYNLFDIAQAKKAPIAVIGMTTRVDAVDLLEKRVKSRFSHRTTAFKIGGNAGNKLDGWWQVLRSGLCIDVDELEEDGEGPSLQTEDWNYFDAWNEHLDFMFKTDQRFRDIIESIFWQTKDVKYFYSHCMLPICNLSTERPFIGGGRALLKDALIPPDSKLYMLQDLPELSLALLICAARLNPILDTDMCNFTMAYDEYKTLVAKVKVYSASTIAMKIWNKEVSLSAWETLADHELIIPIQGSGSSVAGTKNLSGSSGLFRREARMYRVDVGLFEIKKQGRSWGMGSILQSWCTI